MKTFFCVITEVYANGSVKTGIITRNAKALPGNTLHKTPISRVYNTWYETFQAAQASLAPEAAA